MIFKKDVSIGKNRLYTSHKCGMGRISSLKSLIFIVWMMVFVPYAFGQAVADRQASAKPQSPFKVAILPLTIHSPEDLSYMQEGLLDMLSSRVELNGRVVVLEKGPVKKALAETAGEMDSAAARNLGQALGADFVVFGSLTKLGDSASLDLKVVEVKGEKPAASVYVQARKMEEVIARVDELARRVDEKVLGYPLTPLVAEKPVEAAKGSSRYPWSAGSPSQLPDVESGRHIESDGSRRKMAESIRSLQGRWNGHRRYRWGWPKRSDPHRGAQVMDLPLGWRIEGHQND